MPLTWLLFSCCALAPVPAAGPQRIITVDEAVRLASNDHPDILAAEHDMRGAKAASNSGRGRLLPRVDVSDMQQWTYTQKTASPNVLPGFNPASLRNTPGDITANILTVSATQPLLGLLHAGADYQAANETFRAQKQALDGTRAALRAQVRSNLISLFRARALTRTAIASQQSLEEQVEDARQEADAGVLARTDVLRMEAAAANAKQQVIASQAETESIHAALLEMLNLGDSPTPIEFVEPEMGDVAVAQVPELPALRVQALSDRPELRAQHHLAKAAHKRAQAKSFALLPEINAQALYGHVFAEPIGIKDAHGGLQLDAFVAMLSAKWAVWEWGASVYAQQEARHSARAAQARAESARRRVGAEVAAKHAQLLASASAIHVAQAQVDSAEEAFRVMQASRTAGSATTTDLLQAEAARTQARMNLISARYDTHLADVALKRALGADTVDPSGQSRG